MLFCLLPKQIRPTSRWISIKEKLSGYKFPEIQKDDCEQKYISGWGPGGQKVNTSQNAVQLKHIPTGVVVHESRLLHKNIDIAFERMKHMVDRHLNGENCYEEQYKRLQREKEIKAKRKRDKQRALRIGFMDDENKG
uniref:RF_PROK_I domain-containing protein n=1 Tax=Heterorhabditis bacteriophora TaxID=37862 RepID=A0A1I7WMD8_HETBA